MAVINSVVVGRGKKSVGEVTLAYQRQRTIARRRVTENLSNTPAQAKQRGKFGSFIAVMYPHIQYIKLAYQKSQYGSQFNNFTKVNWSQYNDALASDHMGLNQKFISMLIGGNEEFKNLKYYTYGDFSAECVPSGGGTLGSKLSIPSSVNSEMVGNAMSIDLVSEYTDKWRFSMLKFYVSDGKERLILYNDQYPLYKEGETLINWRSDHQATNIKGDSYSSSIVQTEDGHIRCLLSSANFITGGLDDAAKIGGTVIMIPLLHRYNQIVKVNACMCKALTAKD